MGKRPARSAIIRLSRYEVKKFFGWMWDFFNLAILLLITTCSRASK